MYVLHGCSEVEESLVDSDVWSFIFAGAVDRAGFVVVVVNAALTSTGGICLVDLGC